MTPLWCKSNYSFLEGASFPEELVQAAKDEGFAAIAITDRDGVYGVVRAHQRALEIGMKLLIGSEVTLDDGATVVLIAMSRRGYANLCQLITTGRMRCEKGRSAVTRAEVCAHADELIALTQHAEDVRAFREAFGDRLYALLARHFRDDERTHEVRLRGLGVPVVAAPEILYHEPGRRRLQDVVTCLRHQTTLSEAGRLLKPNDAYGLVAQRDFERRYADCREALELTDVIAARCNFSMGELRYVYPGERLPDGMTPQQWLEKLTFEGAAERGVMNEKMTVQLRKELQLIEELDYGGYFLTMRELVQFCRSRGILCQGRGSAASSAVCFCLGITAVDPVKMDFLFERFLSRERAEPPDIDLDIEHERREEVIQHLFERHGRTHAAMVANVVSFRGRSAAREVGKALGVAETELDRYAKLIQHFDEPGEGLMHEVGLDANSTTVKLLSELCDELRGFPRHLSIHPGGFVLGSDPLATLVPIENATMEGRTVIQWNKDDLETLGLFKVDLLALGALTHLHRVFDLLKTHRDVDLTLAKIPEGDPETYDAICKADTIGVFQIESRAQMSMLPRLKPRNYYDIVIQVSIVRPGPISGGMVHPYLRRRNKQESIDYPHPSLIPVLERTLGVPLFQEQVMRLAIVGAGYTPGQADQLRRDMAAWRRNGKLEGHRDRLIEGMTRRGISREFAERVFQQIRGFGEYGFPESHAASFALISYAGAYLKAHYPAEFLCGILNSLPMGFYSASTLIEDSKRHGVEVRPIDITKSEWLCTLEPNGKEFAVRMGMRFVKGLSEPMSAQIREAREKASIEGLSRSGVDERSLRLLAEAGALEPIEKSRRAALWKARGADAMPLALDEPEQLSFTELTPGQSVSWDYERTSHSTRGHPVAAHRAELRRRGWLNSDEVKALKHNTYARVAGAVIGRQRPATASGVVFMTLEDETGLTNLVVWRDVFDQHLTIIRTRSFLGVEGRVQFQDNVLHVIAESFADPLGPEARLPIGSRDFH